MCLSDNAVLGSSGLHYGAILLSNDNGCVLISSTTTTGTTTSSLLSSHMTSQLCKDCLLFGLLVQYSYGGSHTTYRDEVVLPAPFAVHVVLRSDLIRFVHALAALQPVHGDLLVAIA
jgi:hypothetical protein